LLFYCLGKDRRIPVTYIVAMIVCAYSKDCAYDTTQKWLFVDSI